MSVPHPGGDPNANLYAQLKRDVLDRVPQISTVEFVPKSYSNGCEATVSVFVSKVLSISVKHESGSGWLVVLSPLKRRDEAPPRNPIAVGKTARLFVCKLYT